MTSTGQRAPAPATPTAPGAPTTGPRSTARPTPGPRPAGPGGPATVPPPWLPLSFFGAAAVGLVGCGIAVALAAGNAVDAPTAPGVIATVHVTVLAFLSVAVLGALHQFAPVVGNRPLRSKAAGVATLVLLVAAAWLLPTGFAHGPEDLVVIGGACGALAVLLALWNLSAPLLQRGRGVPVAGLRCSVLFLAVTVSFGVVYAIDRQTGWFPLYEHRVLAHAHLGLLGWLGLTYVSVAEKLWPMFLLAHRPRARSGTVAVTGLAVGVAVLAPGLLFALKPLAVAGAVIVAIGLGAHLFSFIAAVRHRRRPLELLHAFLLASVVFLVVAVVCGAVAGLAPLSSMTRTRVVAAEVAALVGWLALAVIGHAHKVVPFIVYSALRARGVTTNRSGGPLLFSDLYHHGTARVVLVGAAGGLAALITGLLVASPTLVVIGGIAVSATGVLVAANLTIGPLRARQPGTEGSA